MTSISTPILLTISAVLSLFIYWMDKSLLDPGMTVFIMFLLAAMAWLKYRLENSFDRLIEINEEISRQRDRFSEMFETEVGRNLRMTKTINDCIKEIQKMKDDGKRD